jgi:hypothetical protein
MGVRIVGEFKIKGVEQNLCCQYLRASQGHLTSAFAIKMNFVMPIIAVTAKRISRSLRTGDLIDMRHTHGPFGLFGSVVELFQGARGNVGV